MQQPQNNKYQINGIQQIGIGVNNLVETFNWYNKYKGFNILVFDDVANAQLMTKYTGNSVEQRRALLSLNLNGGGGLEIWQFTKREPLSQKSPFLWGSLGINALILKTNTKTAQSYEQDLNGNWLVLEPTTDKKNMNSGVAGVVKGVSNMEKALTFYRQLFKLKITSDKTITGNEFHTIPGGNEQFRKVELCSTNENPGGFGTLYGKYKLVLLECLTAKRTKIYEDRYWGDLGYIHLCFDVFNLENLKSTAANVGYHFTVDSADSFNMGAAAGRFVYLEDPDGTLIELVETHKVPICKPLNLYYNLRGDNGNKPVPNWLVKALAIHKKRKLRK